MKVNLLSLKYALEAIELRVTKVEEGEIYVNSRHHLILKHGKQICYIDIPKEAIVYTRLDWVKSDDWELYVPQTIEHTIEPIPLPPSLDEQEQQDLLTAQAIAEEEVLGVVFAKRGRPKGSKNKNGDK